MSTDYYAAIRSGDPVAEATVHEREDCDALADADLNPRPISEALVESTDPELCEKCVGNSNDSDSGGDGESETEDTDGYLRDQSDDVQISEGVCPWCPPDDRYEGDHVGRHASSAHPEKWNAYKND